MKYFDENLIAELKNAPSLDYYLEKHMELFINESAEDYLGEVLKEKGITKTLLAKRSCISEIYIHQILSKKRTPSRNRVISICFGIEADFSESQKLLKLFKKALLDPKNRRDSIIIYGLLHKNKIQEVNKNLILYNEQKLF